MRILLYVYINDIDDIQTYKINLFNNGFYLCQLTDYRQLFMIN